MCHIDCILLWELTSTLCASADLHQRAPKRVLDGPGRSAGDPEATGGEPDVCQQDTPPCAVLGGPNFA